MTSRLKLSLGACRLSSGRNSPSMTESSPVTRLMSAMIGTLPPSRRYSGGRPQTAVTAASVARKARARIGDWSFGVLGARGNDDVGVALVLVDELDLHALRRARRIASISSP
jgi:hypothetical protein